MRNRARLMLLLSALLLVPAYMLPLWSIRIVAPQYNDGLGMYIGLRDIWGHGEHDIQNINILNHYIGMKPIVPEQVDVLQAMPWALGLLLLGALIAAVVARRWAVGAWLAAFILLGVAGFHEFYSWNYDYGHNLSPDAPIKVPGMTYQPPLLGRATLLTIRASSYPSWGTLFIVLAFATGAAALWYLWEVRREAVRSRFALALPVGLAVLLAGCTAEREPTRSVGQPSAEFAAEQPRCAYCDGNIPAERFGGELTTRSGVTYRFMSVECLAGFIVAGRVREDEIRTVQVVDYTHGERLIDARKARYVRSEVRRSPNGLNLLAAESEKIAHNLHFFFGGERLDWAQVLELVRQEWST